MNSHCPSSTTNTSPAMSWLCRFPAGCGSMRENRARISGNTTTLALSLRKSQTRIGTVRLLSFALGVDRRSPAGRRGRPRMLRQAHEEGLDLEGAHLEVQRVPF